MTRLSLVSLTQNARHLLSVSFMMTTGNPQTTDTRPINTEYVRRSNFSKVCSKRDDKSELLLFKLEFVI